MDIPKTLNKETKEVKVTEIDTDEAKDKETKAT